MTIIIGAVVLFVFGFLWYGPLFGKQWMAMMKFTPEEIEKGKAMGLSGMKKQMFISLVFALITTYILSYLVPALLPVSFSDFLKTVLVIWLGFIGPVHINTYLWEGKSFKLVLFNSVYSILSFSIVSYIIYYWG